MEVRPHIHPSGDSLKAFALGKLDDASAEAVFSHLDTCEECRHFVSTLPGDDFLDRLRLAHGSHSTPAPAQSLTGPNQSQQTGGWPNTTPPQPGKALQAQSFTNANTLGDLPSELIDHPHYEVLRELGRGGMGVVYLARNKMMDRLEVLKVMNRSQLERSGSMDRFLQEIQSAAKLNHKNVVMAYSVVPLGDLLAFAMEYVAGEDLG